MNCQKHPDRAAVGACVKCWTPVCAECRVMLGAKFYCKSCADAAVVAASAGIPARTPNWFERHLNWTAFLTWLALYPLSFLAGMIVGVFVYSADPYASESVAAGLGYLIGFIVSLAWLIPTNGWVLRKKGQSLWHLLWLWVPFGVFVFLNLRNKNAEEWDYAPARTTY